MVESGRVPKRGKIQASTGEGFGRVPEKVPSKYRRRVRASTKKAPGEYRRRVQASTREGSGQVPEKGSGKYRKMMEFEQILKKGSGEYRRRVRASTEKAPGEYRRRLRASTGEALSKYRRRVRASTEKWWNPGDRTQARCRGTTELKGGRDAITKAQNT